MPRLLIDLTGKTIDGAVVISRNRTEVPTQTKWDMKCNLCGEEFVTGYWQLKRRRHSHTCADKPQATSITAATATVRHLNHSSSPALPVPITATLVSPPLIARIPRPTRPMSPEEIGALHARQYAMSRFISGTVEMRG